MWRWAVLLHSLEGTWTPYIVGVSTLTGHDTARHLTCWSTTQHVGTVHRWTCMPWDMVTLLTRVGVSLDPLKQTWCSTSSELIECYAMPVSAVCHWMCSLLDVMRSRAVLGGICVVALAGRIRTCLICAVHDRTCWKGHAMLYDEGSVAIANTVTMYMQWRSCCFPPYWYVIGLS